MICRFWFLAIFPPAILAKNMFGMIYTAVHCSDSLIYQAGEWMMYTAVHCSDSLIYQADEWMMYTAVHCSDALIYQADEWMMYTAVHCSDALIYQMNEWCTLQYIALMLWCIRWMNDVHCSTLFWCSDIYQMNEWCTLQYIALMLWYISDEWMMYTAVHCSDALIYQTDELLF